jgi:hypothetical protein
MATKTIVTPECEFEISNRYVSECVREAEEFVQELRDKFIKENEKILGWNQAYAYSRTSFYVVD